MLNSVGVDGGKNIALASPLNAPIEESEEVKSIKAELVSERERIERKKEKAK